MGVYEVAISRRSVRRFKDAAVPYAVLEKCVNAARLAPTGRNNQLCEHIIIDDERLLPRVSDNIRTWAEQPEQRPQAYIITMINSSLETENDTSRSVAAYDVGMAMENMILVAQEQGIGTCPVLSFKEGSLKQILTIPDSYRIALVLALGYADENPILDLAAGSTERWIDDQGTRHVPKRKLKDVAHHNSFP